MIKICHLISSCLVNHGPNNVIIPIVSKLPKPKYQSTVFSLYPPPVNRSPELILRSCGVSFRSFNMNSFLDVRILIPLIHALRTLRPDILHCHLVRANIYGRIAAKLAGVPVVICAHHGIEDYMLSRNSRDRLVRFFERITERYVTCHVGVSETMRLAAIENLGIGSDKIVAIPNGVDLKRYGVGDLDRSSVRRELGLDPNAIVIGSVGNLNRTKNFKLLVHIAELIAKNHQNVQFIIFGDGEERNELESMVVELGLRGSFIFHGYSADIPRSLTALDIFTLTSHSEGFGLAVAEAMAAGLPCVTFDVGALGELIVDGQSGFLIQAGNVKAFEIALDRLINTPGLRSRMGQAAQERAKERFSVELMVQRYGDLYDRVILGSHLL